MNAPRTKPYACRNPYFAANMAKYSFGGKSLNMLTGVHPDLVAVIHRAMDKQIMDFSVLEGVRTLERQKALVAAGASQTLNSKHLIQSDGYSHAVDIAPHPLNWKDTGRFYVLNGIVRSCAVELGVNIRTGADWDNDGEVLDQTFIDLPHVEMA